MIPAHRLPFPVPTDRGYVGACQRAVSEESLRACVEHQDIAVRFASSPWKLFSAQLHKSTAQACLKNAQLLRPINQGVDFIFGNVTTNQKVFYIRPHHLKDSLGHSQSRDVCCRHDYYYPYAPSPVVVVPQTCHQPQEDRKSKVREGLLVLELIFLAVAVAYLGVKLGDALLTSGNPDNPHPDTFRPASFKLIQASSFIGFCVKSALLIPGAILGVAIGISLGFWRSLDFSSSNRSGMVLFQNEPTIEEPDSSDDEEPPYEEWQRNPGNRYAHI